VLFHIADYISDQMGLDYGFDDFLRRYCLDLLRDLDLFCYLLRQTRECGICAARVFYRDRFCAISVSVAVELSFFVQTVADPLYQVRSLRGVRRGLSELI